MVNPLLLILVTIILVYLVDLLAVLPLLDPPALRKLEKSSDMLSVLKEKSLGTECLIAARYNPFKRKRTVSIVSWCCCSISVLPSAAPFEPLLGRVVLYWYVPAYKKYPNNSSLPLFLVTYDF